MERVYVIMKDTWDDEDCLTSEPVDVVSSLDTAERICFILEDEHPENTYYYRAVISSEG